MGKLHIILLPVMAYGHMIPILDMAKLFTARGVKTTIIATPAFAEPIRRAQQSGHNIGMSITQFPPPGSSLPKNIVGLDQMTTPDLAKKFFHALELLQEPVEKILQELQPDCLLSDIFLPWTTDSAAKFGIPRLVFHGTSCFSQCVAEQVEGRQPYKNVTSDSEPFIVPNLPHELRFVRTQMSPYDLQADAPDNDFAKLVKRMRESGRRSYGEVENSFYELEPDYADHFRKVSGRRAWHIGPLLLCNNKGDKESIRGKKSDIDEHECLAWLDSKMANSVVYMCFGSTSSFSPTQLHEMAVGLENSGQYFVWVVRKGRNGDEDWLPQGFEERMKGKGLIIWGWAPQAMILDHPAIGAFVTHCGWNSILEATCAGVPMVTWPLFAEQFVNEKLITEVVGTGVSVGNKKWQRVLSEGVGSEAVAEAVARVMVGQGAVEMRSRAKQFKAMASKAVEEGGSSYNGLNALIEELSTYVPPKNQDIN